MKNLILIPRLQPSTCHDCVDRSFAFYNMFQRHHHGDDHHHSNRRMSAIYLARDADEFSESYDHSAIPVGADMTGHDIPLLGPKTVMLDAFIIDLQTVDTSAQTFRLKLLANVDWEDDGTIEPEVKGKRGNLGSSSTSGSSSSRSLSSSNGASEVYKTGKYVLKTEYRNSDENYSCRWDPQIVIVNAIADESPIEITSSVQMLNGRPIISKSVLYQPECRCTFSYANFPFDETDLVVKLSSNAWNSEQVNFVWSHRLQQRSSPTSALLGAHNKPNNNNNSNNDNSNNTTNNRRGSVIAKSVDTDAVGGVGLSEFEIVNIRVTTTTKVMHSMSRYDNAEGISSEAHLIIRVRRDPYSYLLRVASVAELLMLLEVVSFLVHGDDMADRFSISGTIFLAMVSLYGPMSDCLPKVSVVTRVDRW